MRVKIVRLLLLWWVFPILASCEKSEPFAAKTPKPAISAAPAQAKANLTPTLAVSTALPTSLPLTATPAPTIKETSTDARPYVIAPESLAWDNDSRWLAYISSQSASGLAIRNITGDGSIDYTYDAYQVYVENGELVNLSRSNPAFDPLIDGFQKFKLNPGYQTDGFTWGRQGQYLYRTRDYHNRKEGEGPILGFIARDAAGKIIADQQPTAERWSAYPTWLGDGRLAWIDVIPGYPYPNHEYAFRMQAVIIDHIPVLKQDLTIEWPAWAPDGSILAYIVRSKGPDSAPDTIQWLILR